MKTFLLHCSIALLSIHSSLAQTGSITGTVTDEQGNILSDVNIYIARVNRGTSTDQLGRFKLDNLPAGQYEAGITFVGFEGLTQTVDVHAAETTTLNVILKPGQLLLSDVVVTDQFEREINTISQVDIRLRPINTSQEILRIVPGLFIAQHAGGGKAEQIFLRGFDIDHGTDINLEVDGLPVNMVSHAHGQGYSDLHFLIPEVVGSVDFNKGPYYASKGDFTTAGYASFNTKNSFDQNMVKVEGGSYGTIRNVNTINLFNQQNGERRSNAYLASEYFRTNGFFENKQNFSRLNLMGRFNSYLSDWELLTLGISTFTSSWDASGQIPERAVKSGEITRWGSIDPTEGGQTTRTNVWVRYTKSLTNGGLFENQLYYSQYDFNLISNFTFFLDDPVNGDQITQSESRSIYGYRANYSKGTLFAGKNLQSEAGVGFRYDDVNDIHLYHTRSRKEFINNIVRGDVDQTNLYAFVNETWQATSNLLLNAAIRFDYFAFNYSDALTADYERQDVTKPIVSPKLNVSYNANQNLNLYVKGGIGFHSNDTRVVVAQNGKEILPKAYGVDLGGTFKLGDKLLASVALWTLDLEQEFVYVGDAGVVEPSGETHREGVDVSLRYQVTPWLYVDTDVNLTNPKAKGVAEDEDYVPLAPTFTSIGGLSFRFPKGLNGSIRYRYMGDRAANEDNSVVAYGYFITDAVLKYTHAKFEISLSAENLFNTDWEEAQFDTESRLYNESDPVSEIHFTPGTPFFFKTAISFFF